MSRRTVYFEKRARQRSFDDPIFPGTAVSTGRMQRCRVTESGELQRYPSVASFFPCTKPMKADKQARIMAHLRKK